MSHRNLPPLEVGTRYRAADFEGFEFSSQKFHRQMTGEDTAILRLRLANSTTLEIPAQTDDLLYLMRCLIEAYGTEAIDHLEARGLAKRAVR